MPDLPLFQLDAFADRPFSGNPAAVCLLEAPLPDDVLQAIAAENNLSETAFVDVIGGAQQEVLGLRWFTPTVEVDLCGHATLAAGAVVLNELVPQRARVGFQTRSGRLFVERGAGEELVLDLPLSRPRAVDAQTCAQVTRAIGSEPRAIVRGAAANAAYYAELASAAAVRAAGPDLAAVAALGTGLCLTAAGADEARPVDFVSRYFAPSHGIDEDPVTGSAHATLTPFWAERLDRTRLRARQVSRRGGELSCVLDGERVRIGGQCRLVIRGTFRV